MTFFVLGKHADLSTAEIAAVLKHPVGKPAGVILMTEAEGADSALMDRLSGVTKVGTVLATLPAWDEEAVSELIAKEAVRAPGDGKIIFGVSAYGLDASRVGAIVKKKLSENERSVRFVTSKEPELSAVIITTNGLLKSGGEFVVAKVADGVMIGRTLAVQDFEAWSKRDYGRPSRDAKSGMLPPKLARLMVNLAGVDAASSVVLDPFCGSGTVLMEAALMGFKGAIGSDISERAVADTGRNMEWVRKEFPAARATRISVYHSPAEVIDTVVKDPVDAIVTETYLGPPLRREANAAAIKKAVDELMKTLEPSLKAMASVLKPGGKMVIAFPAFRMGREFTRLPIDTLVKGIGFSIGERFLYERPGQRVVRDIVVIKR